MRWFANLSLSKKIIFASLLMLVSALCWGTLNAYISYRLMTDGISTRNQYLVEAMLSGVADIHKQAAEGKISMAEAEGRAKDFVRGSRYQDGIQYFWINDAAGQAVMHPIIPALETQDLAVANPKINTLFKDFALAVENNGGKGTYFGYDWPKPGDSSGTLYPKSSYIAKVPGFDWILGTGVYIDDVQQQALNIFTFQMAFVFVFFISLMVGTWLMSKMVSKPLLSLSDSMTRLAAGDLDVTVTDAGRKDEVGKLSQAFAVFHKDAVEKRELEQRQSALERQAAEEKKRAMAELAASFESRTGSIISSLLAAAEELSASSAEMQQSSQDSIRTSQSVTQTLDHANSNVLSVAQSAEQLSASSHEIAQQIAQVAQKSTQSAAKAEETGTIIAELEQLANAIGDVVSAIKGIAEQTSLLALNATIEAARAGDAGKGFAVVADEVKKLATETAKKTTDVDDRVKMVQQAVSRTVLAVDSIVSEVRDIDRATTAVASAVEEQHAATSEIGRNVAAASGSTQGVSSDVTVMLNKAQETGQAASHVHSAAQELSRISHDLQKEVQGFLREIRG